MGSRSGASTELELASIAARAVAPVPEAAAAAAATARTADRADTVVLSPLEADLVAAGIAADGDGDAASTDGVETAVELAEGQPPLPPDSKWGRLRARAATCLRFVGPGHIVAVGYMDPGNWATDIAAGSQFGYALLVVVMLSSLVAVFVQILCLRLGIASGHDLAQWCRIKFQKRRYVWPLYGLAELAIVATDMAEVIGAAIALNLLFGLPLAAGVAVTALDVVVILTGLQNKPTALEWIVVGFVTTVFLTFVYMLCLSPIDWRDMVLGFVPSAILFTNSDALLVGIGIIGATVMPHNLYLHSSICREHAAGYVPLRAIRFSTADVLITLTLAFVVNSAILIVAASNFYGAGYNGVASIQDAYALLQTLVGQGFATVFAVSLLVSGQSSTITGTLAGQIVAEGFIEWRVKPWLRRLITRLLAILPALAVVLATGEEGLDSLLIISQVVLSMQLPFAVFPLVYFTSLPAVMGPHANKRWVTIFGYSLATLMAGLNLYLLSTL